MPLRVHVSELAERQRRLLHGRFDASFVERARPDCGSQVVQSLVSFRLGLYLTACPFLQAHALTAEAAPPRVIAPVARAPFVLADFVQTHTSRAPFLRSPRFTLRVLFDDATALESVRAVPATRRSIPV